MTTKMKIVGALAAFGMISCATVPPPKELTEARSLYERESKGQTAQVNPAALHEARKAIEIANQEYASDPESIETKDYSYVALRKVQLAVAKADLDVAMQRKEQAQKDKFKKTEAELAAAKNQLGSTNDALKRSQNENQMTQAQLEQERQARMDAEKRANDAADALAKLSDVKRDERGIVLTLSGSVLFASGKSELLPMAQKKLDEVAGVLVKAKSPGFVVEGHTDSNGSDTFNMNLSQARAQSVRDYLVSRGVPSEEIKALGKGETTPIADNTTAEGRANNRRVEIVLLKDAVASAP